MGIENVLVAVCLYLYGKKVKESKKKILIWGRGGEKRKKWEKTNVR